ncbi:MAG: hypothetical protein D6782_12375 [Alphaproteobacteria bacterium]|nr:MAG: hypothetical protein D6782_12375 [Alphaproteobacteria bacterium]
MAVFLGAGIGFAVAVFFGVAFFLGGAAGLRRAMAVFLGAVFIVLVVLPCREGLALGLTLALGLAGGRAALAAGTEAPFFLFFAAIKPPPTLAGIAVTIRRRACQSRALASSDRAK